MNLHFVRRLFDEVYVRDFLFRRCACEVHHAERLPTRGPAIIVSNHESLGDAMVIQLLYPGKFLSSVRPTGARDFFKKSRMAYWAARDIMRMCFIDRGSGELGKVGADVFEEFHAPLREGNILIYFPQGTRKTGSHFRPGVFHLARMFPQVPIVPVLLRGTREMFPPGSKWPRPHRVTVYVGEVFPLDRDLSPRAYAKKLEDYIYGLDL